MLGMEQFAGADSCFLGTGRGTDFMVVEAGAEERDFGSKLMKINSINKISLNKV